MFLIPLNQLESVELVIHSLKIASGEADCSTCPVHKVCMKQCLTIAGAIEQMLFTETLPQLDRPQATELSSSPPDEDPKDEPPKGRARLSVVK
ncbi:hypothetical protein [Geopsychrobacter electrodiphilus]|uniref:hypothetical protein n=1 Tax=Geopsychrobacter electrodiphilus TaxID=225196 RepID=UPI00035C6E3A|nr:hypothetical protein [Geopsychrobacter electrodiphilus]